MLRSRGQRSTLYNAAKNLPPTAPSLLLYNRARRLLNFTSVAAVHIMFLCRFYWARALNTCIPRELFTLEFFSSEWGLLGCRVVSVLDSGAGGPGYKSQPQRCRVTVLGKLFTPIVPLFTKQQNW